MLKKIRDFSLRTHVNISAVITMAGFLILLFFQNSRHDGFLNVGLLTGVFLMLGGVFWHFRFVRCPHCSKPLRTRGGIPKHCPSCGKYIDKFH